MARRRFLVDRVQDGSAELRGDEARHLGQVLRAEPGQQYEISDGAGVYLAEITSVEKRHIVFHVTETLGAPRAASAVTLYAALIKFDRFEWLVEKATEMGVAAIVPVNAARSEKGLQEGAHKRADRWRRIARESSQQARRLRAPEIGDPQSLAGALACAASPRYFLDEKPGWPALLNAIPLAGERRPADSVALLTGPEGGWTDAERAAAIASGWTAVSLGPYILRAESAAISGAAILTHAWWASQLE